MNARDVLMYGQRTLLDAVDGLPDDLWERPGVCGSWSVKDIIAHLASYELVLVDILATVIGSKPTPYLDEMRTAGAEFNDAHVARRRAQAVAETLAEYVAAHDQVRALAADVDGAFWQRIGTQPWYGAQYSLDDLIVYMYYGHKREHSAQIAVYRDRIAQG